MFLADFFLARTQKMIEMGQLQSTLQKLKKQEEDIQRLLARHSNI